jgi:RNA polymerase sigma factor (TIGR02999 family)
MRNEAAGQTLQPTALVHEAWLRLAGNDERRWNDRAHFFRAAAQVMRRILVDRARRKSSLKRDGGERIDIGEADLIHASQDDRVLLINEVLERLEKENPQAAQIITLKFFGGLTNREIVEALGIPERSVERRWSYAKATLFKMLSDEL